MSELFTVKPCPFCGSDDLHIITVYIDDNAYDAIECRECDAIFTSCDDTDREIFNAWNRRHKRSVKVEKEFRVSSSVRTGLCGACGYDVIDSYKHCPDCGAKLEWSK